MERRKFGNTPLEVSAISLGCWIFGVDWWGHYTDERAVELCQFSYDQGITFFDNGDAYGNGRAETVFGKFLKESGLARDKVEIGSKFGYDFYSDPGEAGSHRERKQDFSPAFMRSSLEKSLKRLGTDYVDLYMAHNIKLPQFRDDMFAELEKVKDEGKIKVWGVSLGPAIGWREEGVKAVTEHDAKAVQTVFNLFEQNPGQEFCEVAVVAPRRRHRPRPRQQQHPQGRGQDRHHHRRERPPQVPRPVVEDLRAEEAGAGPPLRHRPRHDRPPARLQVAAPAEGPDRHHRHLPERDRRSREACESVDKPNLSLKELTQTRRGLRARLGPGAGRAPLRHQEQHRPQRPGPQRLRAYAGVNCLTPCSVNGR